MIALVDDHEFIRNLIGKYLKQKSGIDVIGFRDSLDLFRSIEKGNEYSIFIVDLSLENGVGYEILDYLSKNNPDSKVIVYTQHTNTGVIKHCLEYSIVKGFVSKISPESELAKAVDSVLKNDKYTCIESNKVLNSKSQSRLFPEEKQEKLTPKEIEVLTYIWEGCETDTIVKKTGNSKHTIETHRSNIRKKLKSESLIETLRKALDRGYINTIEPYE